MAKHADQGPCCPGCGYNILGVRDMRRPECGRALDVRDFSLDAASSHGDLLKYERSTAIAGVIGIILTLAVLAGLVSLVPYVTRHHFVPVRLFMLILAFGMVLITVGLATGRSMLVLLRGGRRK